MREAMKVYGGEKEDIFSLEYFEKLSDVKVPASKRELLEKMLRKQIKEYKKKLIRWKQRSSRRCLRKLLNSTMSAVRILMPRKLGCLKIRLLKIS